jgi:hypothetical protein
LQAAQNKTLRSGHVFTFVSPLPANLWQPDQGRFPVRGKDQDMTINKSLASSSLAEVIDRILDKGVVIDAFIRVALVGIELIAIEVRAVIASVETYLRYAEAVGLTTDAVSASA